MTKGPGNLCLWMASINRQQTPTDRHGAVNESHRVATAESQLDRDGRLWLVVRCTAKSGRMALTAFSRKLLSVSLYNAKKFTLNLPSLLS